MDGNAALDGTEGRDGIDALDERFEAHRARLRSVAYRMLGSLSEADDAVQEVWLRFSRTDVQEVDNLGGWLTTVVARVRLNLLRSRGARSELPLDPHLPDPVVRPEAAIEPEDEALLADSVGLALLDAFFTAARGGDFDALVEVLDPEVVLRADLGTLPGSAVVRGPEAVAGQALLFADPERVTHPVQVNGAAGVVVTIDRRPVSLMGFTVVDDRVVAIDALGDPERIAALDLPSLTR